MTRSDRDRLEVGSPAGVRVVLDARPLQDPGRAPTTAAYLEGLLSGLDATPLAGESFAFLLQSDLDDPTARYPSLDVVGRRLLPPTRWLRSATLLVDPLLVRGASLGAAWRAERGGAAGAVYHTAGGAVPFRPSIPTVVSLLDLAPWELPAIFRRGPAGGLGQRLRGRLVRDAGAVIVGTAAVERLARRLVHIRRERLRVVPLAPRPAFPDAFDGLGPPPADERDRLGLPERYLVYSGRYDARQDLPTLLRALARLAATPRPVSLPAGTAWPPRVLLVGATPDDRASLARASARDGVGESIAYAPALGAARLAALVRGARAAILPVVSESTGLPAIEAIATGTPVVASAVGALTEIVAGAGILVEPRDPERLAAALAAIWVDDGLHGRLVDEARDRAGAGRRTWSDVAADTRTVWAEVGRRGR